MKTKGRRKSENIIDMRPGKSGDPMFESARVAAKNSDDYSRRARNDRMIREVKNSDTFKDASSRYKDLMKKKK